MQGQQMPSSEMPQQQTNQQTQQQNNGMSQNMQGMDQQIGDVDLNLPEIDQQMDNMQGNSGNEMEQDEDGNVGGSLDGEADDSTMSIINSLNPDDKEAVRKYAISISGNKEQELEMEGVIFTKNQLNEVMKRLNKK